MAFASCVRRELFRAPFVPEGVPLSHFHRPLVLIAFAAALAVAAPWRPLLSVATPSCLAAYARRALSSPRRLLANDRLDARECGELVSLSSRRDQNVRITALAQFRDETFGR